MKPIFIFTALFISLYADPSGSNHTKSDNLQQKNTFFFKENIEFMIDDIKKKVDADEIMIGVMDNKTGKVLSLTSTERFKPTYNSKFYFHSYEPGYVMAPIVLAVALDNNVVKPHTIFKTYNGKMPLDEKRTITDSQKFNSLTAADIIAYTSNIGISQISWKLTGKEFREGIEKFGITKPLDRVDHKMFRANASYGYGIITRFLELFRAYSAFNNNGVIIEPYIARYAGDSSTRKYQVVNKQTADDIHKILIDSVATRTGMNAQYPGLEVGGKGAAAHIVKNGRYVREYHSSFYGFANDEFGHKYTIGVLIIRPKAEQAYFASRSAAPTFRKIVHTLVEFGYLEPDMTKNK